MKNQVLSIDQMQHLASLGVNIKCDIDKMNWWLLNFEPILCYGIANNSVCRAFTSQDILDMLPACIDHEGYNYSLNIDKNGENRYFITYGSMFHGNIKTLGLCPILECAYEMLLWAIENNHLKTK